MVGVDWDHDGVPNQGQRLGGGVSAGDCGDQGDPPGGRFHAGELQAVGRAVGEKSFQRFCAADFLARLGRPVIDTRIAHQLPQQLPRLVHYLLFSFS